MGKYYRAFVNALNVASTETTTEVMTATVVVFHETQAHFTQPTIIPTETTFIPSDQLLLATVVIPEYTRADHSVCMSAANSDDPAQC